MEPSYLETMETWRASQKHLDEAIQHYLQSITTLGSIPSDAIGALSAAGSRAGGIWHEINDDVQTTLSRIQSLNKGMKELSLIRNRSPCLVPVNKLPLEILVHIFRLCVCEPKTEWGDRFTCGSYHQSLPHLLQLSRVCAQWRAVVVCEPSFWSHLSFSPDQHSRTGDLSWNFLQRSVERSSRQDLCLTVPKIGFSTTRPEETGVAFQYLRSFGGDVKHLCVQSCYHYRPFVPWFLANIEAPGIKSLSLTGCDRGHESLYDTDDESYPELSDPKYEPCLLSVRSLHLERASFYWDSPVYHNLVSLTLDNLTIGQRYRPTADDILSILSASPRLHTLRLRTFIFPSNYQSVSPAQVHFEALQNLDLRRMNPLGLIELLPRLFISSTKLSISFGLDVGMDWDGRCRAAMKEFLARVNVARLLFENDTRFSSSQREEENIILAIQDFSSMVPDLQYLTLVGRLGSSLLKVMMRTPSADKYEPWWPKLHTLYAINWLLSKEDIDNLSKAYPVLKNIRLIGCQLPAHPDFEEWLAQNAWWTKVMDAKWVPYRSSQDFPDPVWE